MGGTDPGVRLSPPTPVFGGLQRVPRAQLLPSSGRGGVGWGGWVGAWAEVSRKPVSADVTGADLGSYAGWRSCAPTPPKVPALRQSNTHSPHGLLFLNKAILTEKPFDIFPRTKRQRMLKSFFSVHHPKN